MSYSQQWTVVRNSNTFKGFFDLPTSYIKKSPFIVGLTLFGLLSAFIYYKTSNQYPVVDANGLWIATVKYGNLNHEVKGIGRIQPKESFSVTAPANGLVEKIFVQPGDKVLKNDILMILSNPELVESFNNAQLGYERIKSKLSNLRINIKNDEAVKKAELDKGLTANEIAKQEAIAKETLFNNGVIAKVVYELSNLKVKQTASDYLLKKQLYESAKD